VTLSVGVADGSVVAQVTGTWSATLIFELSQDGSTWIAQPMAQSVASGALGSTTTATGNYVFPVAGHRQARVRASAYSSGTVNVTLGAAAAPTIVGAVQAGTFTIAGISGSVSLPSGASTLAEQQTQTTALQLIDNLPLAESGTHVSGESGVLFLGVRNDAGAALCADGQRCPPSIASDGSIRVTGGGGGTQYTEGDIDATITGTAILFEDAANTLASVRTGNPLPVVCPTCSGSGVQHIDNNTFTGAADDIVPMGALFDNTPPTITDGNAGLVRMDASRYLYVVFPSSQAVTSTVVTFPDNEPFNLQQVGGSTVVTAGVAGMLAVGGNVAHDGVITANPVLIGGAASAAAPTSVSADGDITRAWYLRNGAAATVLTAAGALIGGDATNGLDVDVTRVSGTVTVDSELPAAAALADNTANPTLPGVAAFIQCFDGSTWDRCTQGTTTEATHDGALTPASTVGEVLMFRASATEPANVSATDDAVMAWALPSGALTTTLRDSTGDSAMDDTNDAIRVNIVAGAAAGGTSSTFGAATPAVGTAAGFSDGTNMQLARVVDLDTGGGTQYGQVINLVRRASGGSSELIGSSTSANSLPVVIASDQAAVTITATNLSTNLAQVAGTTTVTAGVSGMLAVGGNIAHDSPVTSNPMLNGGYASATAPTDVSADGDAVRAWYLRNGAAVVQSSFSGTLAAVNNGAASAGTLRVTIANDSSGILASVGTIATSITPGTSAAHLGKAEDAVAGSGDTGVAMLALREDTPTSTAANGDYIVPKTDDTGTLYVNCRSGCGGSGGTSIADDATFTIATTTVTPIGGLFDDVSSDSVNENDAGAVRMSANRYLYTAIRDGETGAERGAGVTAGNALKVDGSATTQPVSGTVTANAGSGTFGTNVAQINGVTPLMGAGNTGTGSHRVTIATDQAALVGLGVYVEDAAETAGGNLAMVGSVRRDTLASSAGTSGDNATINTSADGAVYTTEVATTQGGTSIGYTTSAASTNATNVKASAGNLYSISAINTTTTIFYLRLYNLSSAPTCSSATGFVETIPVPPASAAGNAGGFVRSLAVPQAYGTGIGFCITGGGSSTDNTNAATGVYVTIGYK
jgi:hypothetical protein